MFEGSTTRHPILTRRQMLMTGAAALVVASGLPGGGAIGDDGAQSIVVCRLTPWDAKAAEFAVRATLIRQDSYGVGGRLNFTSVDPNAPATRVPWEYAQPGRYTIGELFISDPKQHHVARMDYAQTVSQPSLRQFDFAVDIPSGTPCYIGDLVYELLAPDANGVVGALITDVASELKETQEAFDTVFPNSPQLVETLMSPVG